MTGTDRGLFTHNQSRSYLNHLVLASNLFSHSNTTVEHAVAQLVEALHYKSEGRGFDSRWCNWNFSFTYSFRSHYGPVVESASNRNEYQEYFLGVKAAGA